MDTQKPLADFKALLSQHGSDSPEVDEFLSAYCQLADDLTAACCEQERLEQRVRLGSGPEPTDRKVLPGPNPDPSIQSTCPHCGQPDPAMYGHDQLVCQREQEATLTRETEASCSPTTATLLQDARVIREAIEYDDEREPVRQPLSLELRSALWRAQGALLATAAQVRSIRDGDLLVFNVEHQPDFQEASGMLDQIRAVTGKDVRLMLLPPGTNLVGVAAGSPDFEPGRYRHYKGGLYDAFLVVRHCDTQELVVVYCSEAGEAWARPLREWSEQVSRPGYEGPRFKRVGP